jgi:hypothetical protein
MKIPSLLAAAGLVVAAIALITALDAKKAASPKVLADPEDFELGAAMGDMQRFAEKLHFAGQAGNWALADFYLHEINEITEAIIKAKVVDEGVAVGESMKAMFPPSIASVREAIQSRDAVQFASRYEGLLTSCNACHATTRHAFVKIVVPKEPTYQNQDFSP